MIKQCYNFFTNDSNAKEWVYLMRRTLKERFIDYYIKYDVKSLTYIAYIRYKEELNNDK